jgi:hypothetical protein
VNLTQVGIVLGKIKMGDSREVTPGLIDEWDEYIGFLDFEDAKAAVVVHRQTSTEYLQPAHIIRNAKAIKAARLAKGEEFCPKHMYYPMPCDKCKLYAELDKLPPVTYCKIHQYWPEPCSGCASGLTVGQANGTEPLYPVEAGD